MFTRLAIFVLGVFMLFFSGCYVEDNLSEDFPLEKTRLRIAALRDLEVVPLLIGENNDYFHEEGIQLKVKKYNHPSEIVEVFKSGEVDGVITGMAEALLLREEGYSGKITSNAAGGYALVTAPESQIERTEELENEAVAITSSLSGFQAAEALLKEGGLTIDKVNVKNIDNLEEVPDAEGYVLPLLTANIWEGKGGNLLETFDVKNGLTPIFVFSEKALETKQENLIAFYQGYIRSLKYLKEKKDQQEKELSNTKLAHLEVSLYSMNYPSYPSLPQEQPWNETVNWMKRQDLIEREDTWEEIMEDSFFEDEEGYH